MKTFQSLYKRMTWPEKKTCAKNLGVTIATLSLWARGERTPTIKHAFQLELLTGIRIKSWIKEEWKNEM